MEYEKRGKAVGNLVVLNRTKPPSSGSNSVQDINFRQPHKLMKGGLMNKCMRCNEEFQIYDVVHQAIDIANDKVDWIHRECFEVE